MYRRNEALKDQLASPMAHTLAEEEEEAWGAMELYFGCRTSDLDHIYKDEMSKAKKSGALTEVYVGLSRQPGQPKACECVTYNTLFT